MNRHRVLAFAIAAVLVACRDTKQAVAVSATATTADSADQLPGGVQFNLVTHGVKRGELTADTGFVMNDQTRFDFRRAHVNFTTETGAPQGTMQSDKAIYDMRLQRLEAWGNV